MGVGRFGREAPDGYFKPIGRLSDNEKDVVFVRHRPCCDGSHGGSPSAAAASSSPRRQQRCAAGRRHRGTGGSFSLHSRRGGQSPPGGGGRASRGDRSRGGSAGPRGRGPRSRAGSCGRCAGPRGLPDGPRGLPDGPRGLPARAPSGDLPACAASSAAPPWSRQAVITQSPEKRRSFPARRGDRRILSGICCQKAFDVLYFPREDHRIAVF